jgi:glutamate-1-semialdehyde 2,1-aminomutase
MYSALQKEIQTYEKRTPKSSAALKKSWPFMPLGVSSNFRSYEPYPLFIAEAQGTRLRDIDGNDYIDFALCFGAIMAGHAHPAIVKAVQEQL